MIKCTLFVCAALLAGYAPVAICTQGCERDDQLWGGGAGNEYWEYAPGALGG
jgi:hypothetical protein